MNHSPSDSQPNDASSKVVALSSAGELKAGLPGEHAVVPDLVRGAIEDLNRIHRSFALHFCLKMGGYVLETFFGGKASHFTRRARGHLSFRDLATCGELNFSASYLWASVAVAAQYCELPAAVADELPLSHHRVLLSVPDVRVKRWLAEHALEAGLSKRQLAEVAREHKVRINGKPGSGRPAHPLVLKHLIRLDKVVQALASTDESELDVDERFRDRVQDLVGKVREDLRLLEARLGQLEERKTEPK